MRVLRSAVGAGQDRYYATAKATQGPMTSSIHNSNDLVSSQKERLEWVTPQISVMGTEYTEGKLATTSTEFPITYFGPS